MPIPPQSSLELDAEKVSTATSASGDLSGSGHESSPALKSSSLPTTPPVDSLPKQDVAEKVSMGAPASGDLSESSSFLKPSHNASDASADVENAKADTADKPKSSLHRIARKVALKYNEIAKYSLAFSSFLVAVGICIMLAGTLIVHRVLLPRIYVCPDGATCRHNLDPSGNIAPHLQTLMQYWLQFGVTIAGWGLTKFMAYESWFVLGNGKQSPIRTLERNIFAMQGSWSDAGMLVLMPQDRPTRQSGTRRIAIFALVQVAIGISISLIVGYSIPDFQSTKDVHASFSYHSNFTLPRGDTRFFSNDDLIVMGQLNNWLLSPNGAHRPITVFNGTLVLRDNRTISTTNPQPSGSRITGNISCSGQGWNASLIPLDDPYLADGHAALPSGGKAYNITNGTLWYATYSYTNLAQTIVSLPELSDLVTTRQYLWASNTSNVIQNATTSFDGGMHYAMCNHTVRMVDLPPVAGPGVQDVLPSQPIIYTSPDDPFLAPCPSNDPMACVSWSIDAIIFGWWQTNFVQYDLIPLSCLSGLIAAYNGLSDVDGCVVDDTRWSTTISTALDALIYTAGVSGNATQDLWATAVSINTSRWYLQTIIPGITFLLYLACAAYTLHLSKGATYDLQELDLPMIITERSKGTTP